MRETKFVDWLCRIYAVMLYAYPRQFRAEYGFEMQRVFRDQSLDAARTHRLSKHFLRSAFDWIKTVPREALDTAPQRGFALEWVTTAIVYLFISTTLVQAYVVPTGSMEKNLRVGDHMLVDKVTFAKPGPVSKRFMPYRDIQRGDIVAFTYPQDVRQTYVKRVIGLPGDRIHLVDKQVIRNGHKLTEPYTQYVFPQPDLYRDNFPQAPSPYTTPLGLEMLAHNVINGEVVVPPDSLFMLGDNRDNSLDSRYWGFVPRSYVVGKPLFVYWSYDAPTEDLTNWTLNHFVDLAQNFFTKTRWDRMFTVPKSERAIE
jgi:signal peptidase I